MIRQHIPRGGVPYGGGAWTGVAAGLQNLQQMIPMFYELQAQQKLDEAIRATDAAAGTPKFHRDVSAYLQEHGQGQAALEHADLASQAEAAELEQKRRENLLLSEQFQRSHQAKQQVKAAIAGMPNDQAIPVAQRMFADLGQEDIAANINASTIDSIQTYDRADEILSKIAAGKTDAQQEIRRLALDKNADWDDLAGAVSLAEQVDHLLPQQADKLWEVLNANASGEISNETRQKLASAIPPAKEQTPQEQLTEATMLGDTERADTLRPAVSEIGLQGMSGYHLAHADPATREATLEGEAALTKARTAARGPTGEETARTRAITQHRNALTRLYGDDKNISAVVDYLADQTDTELGYAKFALGELPFEDEVYDHQRNRLAANVSSSLASRFIQQTTGMSESRSEYGRVRDRVIAMFDSFQPPDQQILRQAFNLTADEVSTAPGGGLQDMGGGAAAAGGLQDMSGRPVAPAPSAAAGPPGSGSVPPAVRNFYDTSEGRTRVRAPGRNATGQLEDHLDAVLRSGAGGR